METSDDNETAGLKQTLIDHGKENRLLKKENMVLKNSVDKRSGYATKSILCAALTNQSGDVIGVVQLLNKEKGRFSEDDLEFLKQLSTEMSVKIDSLMSNA